MNFININNINNNINDIYIIKSYDEMISGSVFEFSKNWSFKIDETYIFYKGHFNARINIIIFNFNINISRLQFQMLVFNFAIFRSEILLANAEDHEMESIEFKYH